MFTHSLGKTSKAIEFALRNVSQGEEFAGRFALIEARNVLVPLIDDLLLLSQHEKFFAAHPDLGLWLWFLLYTHARGQAGRVPERVTSSMIDDAVGFLVKAVQIKPVLKIRLMKMISVTNASSLAQYLPAAAECKEIFEAFCEISKSWTVWNCSGVTLLRPACFAKICSLATVTKLKLRTAAGLDSSSVMVLLSSQIRNSLKSLSLPMCLKDGTYLLRLSETFPAMDRLSARKTSLSSSEVAHIVKLCPALTKLNLAQTLISPDEIGLWIPQGLKKLDLGFPMRIWPPSSLLHMLKCERMDKSLEFLGLAGTSICDEQVSVVFSELPTLRVVDFFKTFVSELILRKVILGREKNFAFFSKLLFRFLSFHLLLCFLHLSNRFGCRVVTCFRF